MADNTRNNGSPIIISQENEISLNENKEVDENKEIEEVKEKNEEKTENKSIEVKNVENKNIDKDPIIEILDCLKSIYENNRM